MYSYPNHPLSPHNHRPRILRRVLAVAVLAGLVLLLLMLWRSNRPAGSSAARPAEHPVKTISATVKPGETASSLFGSLLDQQQLHVLTAQCRKLFPLRQLAVGQPYQLTVNNGAFERFAYDINSDEQLIIARTADGFSVTRSPIAYTVEPVVLQGTIDSSLFQAVVDAGGSDGMAVQLADIFAWDIDFFHDVQVGDSFKAVVEKRYRDGAPAGDGRILAAHFTVQDQTNTAFYFKDGTRTPGYYDQQGRSLRKAFLKAPLSFSRISSGFTMRRRHPITKRVKPHPAIDYAAPTGTPIHTVGNGTVLVAASNRSNGKYVKIRHPNGWMTMYNHLSRFGKGIRKGATVQQGQRIGYVGSTGLSTGPHLDFRMYRGGVAVNPLTIKSPPARPVSKAQLAAFKAMVAERTALLEKGDVLKRASLKLPSARPVHIRM